MKKTKEEQNLEEFKEKLKECQKKKEEYLAGWQRARADFLNYKKEEMERIKEILKYAAEDLVLKILPILDNFDLIEKKLPENLKADINVRGILQIRNQILSLLKNQGIEEIKTVGEKFDPNFMEAVEEVEPVGGSTENEKEKGKSGIVLEEVQKGYKLLGKVLRPARVKVVK